MNIIYVHSDFLDVPTPSISFILNRINGFIQLNIKVYLIIKTESEKSVEELLLEKFNIIYDKSKFEVFLIKKTPKEIEKKIMSILISNDEKNIIYTRSLKFLPYLYKIKKINKTKLFFESHDYYYRMFLRNDMPKLKLIKNSLREKIYLKKVDGIICVNSEQVRLYKKDLKVPIVNISSGILESEIDIRKKGVKEKYLGYIGSLDSRKKIFSIIKIMNFLPNNYKLLLIGGKNNCEIKNVENIIKKNNLEDRIEMLGWLGKRELDLSLRKIDLGLIPLEDSFFNKFLTYPLKLSDYYKYNIPVLTNDFPSSKDYLFEGETGYTVDWDNCIDLKNKILDILEDEYKYNKMKENIKEFKKKNNIFYNSKKLVEFMEEN